MMPSNTGRPGGKRTGQQMSHYVIAGGMFERVAADLLAGGWSLGYYDRAIEIALGAFQAPPKGDGNDDEADGDTDRAAAPPRLNKTNRVRFVCPDCEAKAWGKPGLRISCMECDVQMEAGA